MTTIELTDDELAWMVKELRRAKRVLLSIMAHREKRDGPMVHGWRVSRISKLDHMLDKLAGRAKA